MLVGVVVCACVEAVVTDQLCLFLAELLSRKLQGVQRALLLLPRCAVVVHSEKILGLELCLHVLRQAQRDESKCI